MTHLLELSLLEASMVTAKNLDALGLLQAILPEAKVYTANPPLYGILPDDSKTGGSYLQLPRLRSGGERSFEERRHDRRSIL